MRKIIIRPTTEQLAGLNLVRTRLAERGYLVAPVAAPFRRHKTDFVALRKDWPGQFAIVRIAPTCIVVRPFGEKRGDLYLILPEIRKKSPVSIRRGLPLLKYSEEGPNKWQHYVSDEAHEELVALGCIER